MINRDAAAYWIPAFAGMTLNVARLLWITSLALAVTPMEPMLRFARSGSRLNPFRRISPQGVTVLGAKKTEMADRAQVSGRDRNYFRLDRAKARTEQFDSRTRRPGIIGQAQRAHCPAVMRKILQLGELGIIQQIAFAH